MYLSEWFRLLCATIPFWVAESVGWWSDPRIPNDSAPKFKRKNCGPLAVRLGAWIEWTGHDISVHSPVSVIYDALRWRTLVEWPKPCPWLQNVEFTFKIQFSNFKLLTKPVPTFNPKSLRAIFSTKIPNKIFQTPQKGPVAPAPSFNPELAHTNSYFQWSYPKSP